LSTVLRNKVIKIFWFHLFCLIAPKKHMIHLHFDTLKQMIQITYYQNSFYVRLQYLILVESFLF
jgi:hypothetical protein